MNITLREVYQTSADADRFYRLKECYIRGSTIKYLRVPEVLLDEVKEEQAKAREAGRGARGGAGGGGVGYEGGGEEVDVGLVRAVIGEGTGGSAVLIQWV